MRHGEVRHVQLGLLLAAVVVVSDQVPDPGLSLANERTSIERTYELTKYLEHQLREIKDTYLSYLGPPFSDPDFSPPRPNTTALSLPSAATRLDLWRGLENRARLAQNHRAYSVLLEAVKELARATLCPYLQSSLLHFSAGLDGLLGSISGLMTTLGYALPPQYYALQPAGGPAPNPELLPRHYYSPPGGRERQRSREAERAAERERGPHRDFASDPKSQPDGDPPAFNPELSPGGRSKDSEEEPGEEGEMEGWGRRRRLLSVPEEAEMEGGGDGKSSAQLIDGHLHDHFATSVQLSHSGQRTRTRAVSLWQDPKQAQAPAFRAEMTKEAASNGPGREAAVPGGPAPIRVNLTQSHVAGPLQTFSVNNNNNHNGGDRLGNHLGNHLGNDLGNDLDDGRTPYMGRDLQKAEPERRGFGAREGHTLLSDLAPGSPLPLSLRTGPQLAPSPLLSALSNAPLLHAPSLNDFSRKVESFWVLRELQSWLWRSAKDFNRLKKRLRA
ncbi:uncharacterized protein clcf1 [Megalops cyprinoides]|uniref:uncharacterized protein clcf1 n=1 Tax=Megalops cyprinoides TaxID=118141 RepID=UPI001864DDCD|nr:uncharacterized protein clcf1 [Megalops cyprinoides]